MLNLHTAIKGALVASAVSIASAAGAADAPKVAVDLTTLTSPFWTSYNKYIVAEAKAQGVDLLQPFNSEFDTAKQITGVKNSISLGANGIIFSPFDTSAAGTVLKTAAAAKVPVVAVDVAPDTGPVAIVVRANNIAYGEKACNYIGDHVRGRTGRADHGRPGLYQWTRPRHRFPRLHQEELSEAETARNPNKGLVGRRRRAAIHYFRKSASLDQFLLLGRIVKEVLSRAPSC